MPGTPRPPNVDDPGAFPGFLDVPEDCGTAVVDVGDGAVTSAAAPRTAALLHARGLRPVAVPIAEFEKLAGCVTCLSARFRAPASATRAGLRAAVAATLEPGSTSP